MAERFVMAMRSSAQMAERLSARLTRLAFEGFDVHALAGDDGGLHALYEIGLTVKALPIQPSAQTSLATGMEPAGLLASYLIMQGHLLEHQPMVVHAQGDALWCAICCFAADRAGARLIVATVEGCDDLRAEELPAVDVLEQLARQLGARLPEVLDEPLQRWRRWPYRILNRHSDRVIVRAAADRDQLLEQKILPAEKLQVMGGLDGVDLEAFVPAQGEESAEQARQALGLEDSARRWAGYRGPLTANAGARVLIETIEQSLRSNPGLGWLVQPRGSVEAKWLDRLQSLRSRNTSRLQLVDQLEAPRFYRALDLFLWPALRDGDAHPALEAMASARPVLAFALPGLVEIAGADGANALFLPRDQPSQLAAGLERLLANPSKLEEMGSLARRHVRGIFDRETIDEQMLLLYDGLLRAALHSIDA